MGSKRSAAAKDSVNALKRAARMAVEQLEQRMLLSLSGVPTWQEQGPGTIVDGGYDRFGPNDGITNQISPETGAVQQIVADPNNPNILYAGTVDGGVWKTTHATWSPNDGVNNDGDLFTDEIDEVPDWQPLTDSMPSLAIGALAMSPVNSQVLYAGTGSFSSHIGRGGRAVGVYKTSDGGANWTVMGQSELHDLRITSIIPTSLDGGNVILVSTIDSQAKSSRGGLYRSTDGGATWTHIVPSGLPTAFDVSQIVWDPRSPDSFYAGVPGFGILHSGGSQGSTWTLSNGDIDAALIKSSKRFRLAVHFNDVNNTFALYTAIIDTVNFKKAQFGTLRQIYRTTDATSWQALGVPLVSNGNQAYFHLSLAADPSNPAVVFAAGDHAPDGPQGVLYRRDAQQALWTPVGVNDRHADSRSLTFADGMLLDACDGGIYRLRNVDGATAKWESLDYGLRDVEMYRAAYDPLNDVIFGGTQDNGNVQQKDGIDENDNAEPNSPVNAKYNRAHADGIDNNNNNQIDEGIDEPAEKFFWNEFLPGDGGNVAIAQIDPTHVWRFAIGNSTDVFYRLLYDDKNNQTESVRVKLSLTKGGADDSAVTEFDKKQNHPNLWPLVVNAIDPTRILIGNDGLYEGVDADGKGTLGDLVVRLSNGGGTDKKTVSALAYGGRIGTVDNPDVIYVARRDGTIGVRTKLKGAFTFQKIKTASSIVKIVLDPTNWKTAYAIDSTHVYRTTDGGATPWKVVAEFPTEELRGLQFVRTATGTALVVGGMDGVYRKINPDDPASLWTHFGQGLPHAPVYDLTFIGKDPSTTADDQLLVATLGRGAWTVSATDLLTSAVIQIAGTAAADQVRLALNPTQRGELDVFLNGSATPLNAVELDTIEKIVFTGAGGDDTLTVDSSNGAISVPGGITFVGGTQDSQDQLVLSGNGIILDASAPTANQSSGDVHIGVGGDTEIIHFSENEKVASTIALPLGDLTQALRNGLRTTNLWSSKLNDDSLLGHDLPGSRATLGRAFNGIHVDEAQSVEDEEETIGPAVQSVSNAPSDEEVSDAGDELPLGSSQIFSRLMETGLGAFDLSSITSPADLQQRLDALDETSGNVTMTTATDGSVRYNATIVKELEGLADLDVDALNGLVSLGGTIDLNARVTMHLIFGVDSKGFFIDADSNPDPEVTIDHISGTVSGGGSIGFIGVQLENGTFTFDPDAKVLVNLHDPGTDVKEGYIRLNELGDISNSLATAVFQGDPGDGLNDDVKFDGDFKVSLFDIDLPDLTLGLDWSDLNDLSSVHVDPSPTLQKLLDVDAGRVAATLLGAANQFTSISGVDLFAQKIPLVNKSLNDLLGGTSDEKFDSTKIDAIGSVFSEDGYNKFVVQPKGLNPLLDGITVGNKVTFKGDDAADHTGEIDSVDQTSFSVRFALSDTHSPATGTDTSIIVTRNASLQKTVLGPLAQITNPTALLDRIPTIQELVQQIQDATGIDGVFDNVRLSAANDSIEMPFDFTLSPIKFAQRLDFGGSIAGLNFSAGTDLDITVEPKFHFTVGVQFGGDVPIEQRVYLLEDAGKEASLGITIAAENPSLTGTVGFLNVKLGEDGDQHGVQINGTVALNLTDPGDNGRITVNELTPSNLADTFDASIDATFAVDPLKITADLGSGDDSVSLGQISIKLDPTHITSLSDLSNLSPQISGKTAFEDFTNITPQMILAAIQALIEKLRGLGAGGVFDTRLPLINKSVSDLLKLGDQLANDLGTFDENNVLTAKGMENFLQSHVDNALKVTVSQDAISFKLNFTQSVSENVPLNLDLGSSWGLLKVTSGGNLSLSGTASAALGFGLLTGANIPLDQRLFLSTSGDDASKLSLSGSANAGYGAGSPIDADVEIGFLKLHVTQARALLDLPELGGALKDPGNNGEGAGRLTFKEIADAIANSNYGSILGGSFNGRIQALIPLDGNDPGTDVAYPPSSTDAWIEVAGKLENLVNGFDTNIDPLIHTNTDTPLTEAQLDAFPFSGSNKVLLYQHNIDNLIESAVLNFNSLIDGLEKLIDWGDKLLGIGGLDFKLPFVNKSLRDALNFFKDPNGPLQGIINSISGSGGLGAQSSDATIQFAANKILAALPSGSTVKYQTDQNTGHILGVTFQTALTSNFSAMLDPLKFDLGLPFLKMNSDTTLDVSGDVQLNLAFGVSKTNNGFFLLTDPQDADGHDLPEFQIRNLKLSLNGTQTISLGFLDLQAKFDPAKDFIAANLAVNLNGLDDDKLTLDELLDFSHLPNVVDSDPNTPGLDGIDLRILAAMDVPLTLDAGADPNLPKLSTTFHLGWGPFGTSDIINGTDAFTNPTVELDSLHLDPGAVIKRMVEPFLDKVNQYNILRPILDELNQTVPIIGGTVADLLGINDNPAMSFLLNIASAIDDFEGNISGVDGLSINFGNVTIPRDGNVANTSGTVVDSNDHTVSTESNPNNYPGGQLPLVGGIIRDLGAAGVTFPVLQLGTLMQLFMGNPADLVFADLSGVHLTKSFDEEIPIYSVGIPYIADASVNALFGGALDLYLNVTAGIDTTGLKTGHLIDGIYLGDFDPGDNHQIDPSDAERPEVELDAGLIAGLDAKISVLGFDLAKITGTAEIGGSVSIDLNDDDDGAPQPLDPRDDAARTDGKFHLNEISTVIDTNGGDLLCMFDLDATLFAKLSFEIHIPGPNPDWSHKWILATFHAECDPTPVVADYADIIGGKLVLTSTTSSSLPDQHTFAASNADDGDVLEILRVDKDNDGTFETLRIRKDGYDDDFGPLESGNDHIDNIDDLTQITIHGSGTGKFRLQDFGVGDDSVTIDPLIQIPVDLAGGDGNDSFSVADGAGGTLRGGEGSDYFVLTPDGTARSFHLFGDGGDDQLSGGRGKDSILGGEGNDTLDGGGGNDDSGADVIVGGGGSDIIDGRGQDDLLVGDYAASFDPRPASGADEGADLISGGGGADDIWGDNKTFSSAIDGDQPDASLATGDLITGGAGSDVVFAGAGDDQVDLGSADGSDPNQAFGGSGNDILIGGDNLDSLMGESGNDSITGGDGNDTLYAGDFNFGPNKSNQGFDTLTGNGGDDLIDGGDADAVTASGGDGNDSILGSRGADNISGDAGRDFIVAGPGNDSVIGDGGDDDIVGGKGTAGGITFATSIAADDGADSIRGGDGNDALLGDNGTIDSSSRAASTVSTGGFGPDTVSGGAGDDSILGGGGADNIDGDGEGLDATTGGSDIIVGDLGTITSTAVTPAPSSTGGGDSATGGAGNDILIGGDAGDNLDGGAGDDLVFGDFGTINRSTGSFVSSSTSTTDGGGDTAHGGTGNDSILGGQGADNLFGDEGDDDLTGGHNVAGGADAADSIDGGAGKDVIAGDNASIVRHAGGSSRTTRTLLGATLYNSAGAANVATAASTASIDVTLLDAGSADTSVFGNDYMAGGAGDDCLFGQAGNDVMQGDGATTLNVSATLPSAAASSDGDDYMEGNDGNDIMFGNFGQDDMIGGSSSLFGYDTLAKRHDGSSDTIFGGAGLAAGRNDSGDTTPGGHARDADVILGDNGNIYRIVNSSGAYLTFTYDNYAGGLRIVPRAIDLLDYSADDVATNDAGGGDSIHGEGGDDIIHGAAGNDSLLGDAQDDDIYGETGDDWISGGAGEDGILGDDGRIVTSRNGATEPLLGVNAVNAQLNVMSDTPYTGAWLYITGRLNKAVAVATKFNNGGNDAVYGGLGDDFIHGGAGNDGISGAEAQQSFYDAPIAKANWLSYDPTTRKLAGYDANHPLVKINNFFLNFDATDVQGNKINDGKDRIFGDGGHDWLVGGTQNDRLFGGLGDDVLNADDNLDTSNGLNDRADAPAFADADFAFGGNGLDVMVANTGADRLFDWVGEFNTYVVPFDAFGMPTIVRFASPAVMNFLSALGKESGADQTLIEPNGELGLSKQGDNGAPRDPQGPYANGQRDTFGRPEDDRNTALPL